MKENLAININITIMALQLKYGNVYVSKLIIGNTSCNLKQAQICNKCEFYNLLAPLDHKGLDRGHLAAVQKEACFAMFKECRP